MEPLSCRIPSGGGAEDVIERIFALHAIAVVGCSPKPERPSHYVAAYLKEQGYLPGPDAPTDIVLHFGRPGGILPELYAGDSLVDPSGPKNPRS